MTFFVSIEWLKSTIAKKKIDKRQDEQQKNSSNVIKAIHNVSACRSGSIKINKWNVEDIVSDYLKMYLSTGCEIYEGFVEADINK